MRSLFVERRGIVDPQRKARVLCNEDLCPGPVPVPLRHLKAVKHYR